MKNLVKLPSFQRALKSSKSPNQANLNKDAKNGECTPGHLFEHYNQVLIRPKDLIDKMK